MKKTTKKVTKQAMKPKKAARRRKLPAAIDPVDYEGYFEREESSPLLDEIVATLHNRGAGKRSELVDAIEKYDVDNFWSDFVGPMLARIEECLFDDDDDDDKEVE